MAATGSGGGDATVDGDESYAQGGDAGETVIGPGGSGGDAHVLGDRSSALGGRRGRGGVQAGMPGGDVEVVGNDTHAEGGQGGEANQADGRGGRGGRAGGSSVIDWLSGERRRPHMRWPYGEPITEPGRGGDAADTPQYMARRLIVEVLKTQYYRARQLPLDDVWWDRELVPLDWINEALAAGGHSWRADIVDWEYEFTDLPS